ncbi:SMC-Scp complex subunit ScpB [Candidatus Caldatribacterium sp.]|uniref:SMC-Scp complex subunit ScpB n=1 Tax=Candidatus Caldatribacterium sp. TaxID=2282143 RepID=UPI002995D66B|nr:SMC-Scp complex subunit ScpB [Candidatus Caldatribacterium sp.]MDW8080763.1 SMC-Scp complex subunit ScpB [Candidatus Calescibacterium sp.]
MFSLAEYDQKFLRNLLEGLLFSSPCPVGLEEMERATGGKRDEILNALSELQAVYEERDGALCIRRTGKGWQMVVKPEYGEILQKHLCLSPRRTISRGALETLAIVSLYQPITKAEIDLKRGVDSAQALRSLLAMGLITVCGRRNVPGRPLLYRVTEKFFEVFGLSGEEEFEQLKRLFVEKG